jgi:hypothetical protein
MAYQPQSTQAPERETASIPESKKEAPNPQPEKRRFSITVIGGVPA